MSDLVGKQRRHSVSNLVILLCPVPLKEVVVRKGLEPGRLPHRQTAALAWIRMDEVMAVLGDVAGDRRARSLKPLNPEAIDELA